MQCLLLVWVQVITHVPPKDGFPPSSYYNALACRALQQIREQRKVFFRRVPPPLTVCLDIIRIFLFLFRVLGCSLLIFSPKQKTNVPLDQHYGTTHCTSCWSAPTMCNVEATWRQLHKDIFIYLYFLLWWWMPAGNGASIGSLSGHLLPYGGAQQSRFGLSIFLLL